MLFMEITKALLGAGCFWGIEEYFRKIEGIIYNSDWYKNFKDPKIFYLPHSSENCYPPQLIQPLRIPYGY